MKSNSALSIKNAHQKS